MSKNISYRSGELLQTLINQNKYFFNIEDAGNILPDDGKSRLRELLSDMTKRGLILRIKDGMYNIIPYENNSDYFPNWHLVAEKLAQPSEYYIGFYSALDLHGLITQPSLVEYIVSGKQFHPKKQIIKNITFEFVKYNENHFFGFEKIWIDDFNKVFCSDLEKTIIDCLYKPDYGSGISEIIKAIYKCKNKIDINKLNYYLNKFKAQVVYKRLGYIVQHFKEFDKLLTGFENKLSNSYAYLDPALPQKGKYNSKWKIIDNIGIENELKSLNT